MAVSVFKTFSSGEILTAADLNSSLTQITGNGEDLGWPATKAKDLDGQELIFDSDGDSSLTVSSDDVMNMRLQGVNLFNWDGSTASSVNGLTWAAAAAGNPATVTGTAQGASSNININIVPKGSGVFKISGTQFNLIPQNSKGDDYTLVIDDAGKHLYHPSGGADTFTIPANASVAFPIGTAVTFVNDSSAGGDMTIAITSDTMRLSPEGTTGSRTLAVDGIATAIKVAATKWMIAGTGLT